MLTAIKQRATGWVAWAIVILITIPFALWGINSYFEGGTEVSVASVNGEPLSLYAYQDNLQNRVQSLRQQLGDDFDPELLESLQIGKQVIDAMVDQTIMDQYVVENRFLITDEQLNRTIHSAEIFQTDGQFDPVQYRNILAASRYTPELYEELERIGQAGGQVRSGIIDSAFALNDETDRLLAMQEQQREIQYALLETGKFSADIDISEEQIQDYFDNNAENFVSPARMKVRFVVLDVDTLSNETEPDEQQITDYYEEHKGKYRSAESRRARHILVEVDQAATDEERDQKRDFANELLERVRGGEDFAVLAEQYSDDPGSKSNGGDLGVIARGQMVKPFEDAVYAMSEGDIEGPVETQYGFHVVNLVEFKEQQQQTLEEVREDVVSEVQAMLAEQRFAELAEPFMNLVFEHPEDLEIVSEELDLEIQDSDWFTESAGEGIADESKVRRAAFSEEVLAENLVSQPIEIGFERIIAIQKLEHEPAAGQSLDTVRDEIDSILREETAKQQVSSLGREYADMLEEMDATAEEWVAFIEEKELEIVELTLANRNEIPASQRALGEAAYAASRPRQDEITLGSAILANGDYALYKLISVTDGDPEQIEDTTRQALSSRLSVQDGSGMMSGFSRLLKEQADIQIYEERL